MLPGAPGFNQGVLAGGGLSIKLWKGEGEER
jgi:hypothetical protein